jgi:MFS family permease
VSSKTTGDKNIWKAVALGWAMAVLVATVVSPTLGLLYGLFVGPPPSERGELTATILVISVVSGFLSYLVGGYVAAKMARHSGGKHGALTAVFGLIIGVNMTIVLALFGLVFPEGFVVPPASFGFADVVPPVSFGLSGTALLAGFILFLVSLFGGFVGGKLGEPSYPGVKRLAP